MRYATLSMLTHISPSDWQLSFRKTYGHKVYAATLRLPGADRDSWSCDHYHRSEVEATACAREAVYYIEKQIARGR